MSPLVIATLACAAGIALLILGCGAHALLTARRHRTLEREAARQFEQLDLAAGDLKLLCEGIAALDAKLAAVASRVESLARSTPAAGVGRGYGLAVRMARGGAGRDQIVSSCGLGAQEADLVARLHGAAVSRTAPSRTGVGRR